jgi:hypothetical protein
MELRLVPVVVRRLQRVDVDFELRTSTRRRSICSTKSNIKKNVSQQQQNAYCNALSSSRRCSSASLFGRKQTKTIDKLKQIITENRSVQTYVNSSPSSLMRRSHSSHSALLSSSSSSSSNEASVLSLLLKQYQRQQQTCQPTDS